MSIGNISLRYRLWRLSITAALEGRALLWAPGYRPGLRR